MRKIPFDGITIYYNGRSNKYYDLIVTEVTQRQRLEENIELIEIEGRSGTLVDRLNTFKSYERKFMLANVRDEMIPLIHDWLRGRGELRTSIDENGFFRAEVIGPIEREHIGNLHSHLTVTFLVDFFYLDSGTRVIKPTKGATLRNVGNHDSEPYIKVYGSGAGTLSIGGQQVHFTGISSYIEIDSALKICHKDRLPAGKQMSGNFPILPLGESVITWSGGITGVEITPRWREI